jgi:arylsulfatase A
MWKSLSNIKFLGVISLILAGFSNGELLANQPPNVLILYADDLGYGDISVQNPKGKIKTPHVDQLATTGMRFTNGHSSSGICTPSRYALLTGRYHWRSFHDIVNSFGPSVIEPDRLTIAEMLKQKGYDTAAVGKWHLGWNWDAIRDHSRPVAEPKKKGQGRVFQPADFDWSKPLPGGPLAHGFDTYFGDDVINFPPYGWIENDRMPIVPSVMMDTALWKPIKEGNWECRPGPMVKDWDPYQVLPTLTQRGVDFLESRKGQQTPFFLYFAFPSPHAPIIPNDEFDGKSGAGAFGDFVVQTDDAVGRMLRALDESGLADNTIVFFTADNGPEQYAYARDARFDHWSAEPFRGLKRDIYEGGHHVPYIIRWPGLTKAGSVSDALISQIDFMATLAAFLNFPLESKTAEDSHNMLPVLKGEAKQVRTAHVHNTYANKYAIREGDLVLINAKDGYTSARNKAFEEKHGYPVDDNQNVELYNLKTDPGQRRNIAADQPQDTKHLLELLGQLQAKGHFRD